jgi:hypothetical protein
MKPNAAPRNSSFSEQTQSTPVTTALPSRRDFLKISAGAALTAAAAGTLATAADSPSPARAARAGASAGKDSSALAARFNKFLRVTDVTDGLDAVGRADLTLLDPAIRPLWMGMKFWGPALTLRVVPTNRRMPIVERKDALKQHGIWSQMGGMHAQPATLMRS